jgi:catechol 2,3-dioxygenase-like lactoylglutathione lyase family enzyme
LLGHLSFGVRDLARAMAFYDPVLATIGFVRVWSHPTGAGYGPAGGGDKFALKLRDGAAPPGKGFHLAFDAAGREAVDRFHAAALAHGGRDNGAPGLRPRYSPTYYAAFVIDPDAYEIEAVHQ